MTKEKAKEIIDVLQGWLDGKEIKVTNDVRTYKLDLENTNLIECNVAYSIKQEPKYRPFTFDDNWKEYFRLRPVIIYKKEK